MSYVTKLYDKMLLARLSQHIERWLRTEQNGFRPHRNTIQHALALRLLQEDIEKRKGQSGIFTFVDYTNAFPSVTWAAIKAALHAFNVPQSLISAIMKIYHGHKISVLTSDGLTEGFSISAGVLQGDTLAPFLFILVLDCIMHKTINSLPNTGIEIFPGYRLTDLNFADDIALFARDAATAQKFLTRLANNSAICGLDINPAKTEFMILGDHPPAQLHVGTHQLKQTSSYKYLGVNTDTDNDIKMRTGQAWTVMRQLTPAWRSTAITLASKYRLWRSLVEPILLYGTSTYALTLHREMRLCGCVTRMLRYIRGAISTQHMELKEIYSTYGADALDIPQITTTIVIRQLALLSRTAKMMPTHPLITILMRTAPGKKIASRQLLLRDQISERLGFALSLARLQTLTSDEIHTRAQLYEQAVYDRAAAAHARRRVRNELDLALSQLPHGNEDIPLAAWPKALILKEKTLEKRLRTMETNHPGALSATAQELIQRYQAPIRTGRNAPQASFNNQKIFWIHGAQSGAGIFDEINSQHNVALPCPNLKRFHSEASALETVLREFPHTPLIINMTHVVLLKKIKTLPRNYYKRMLRKHILWKTIFLHLRNRTTSIQFNLSQNVSSAQAARILACAAAVGQSIQHVAHKIANLQW